MKFMDFADLGLYLRRSPLTLLAGLSLLSACGPASDTVTVKLRTGLESLGSTPNLMMAFSLPSVSQTTFIGSCVQRNLRAGFKIMGSPDVPQGIAVPAVRQAVNTMPYTFLGLVGITSFPEISLQVPRNTPLNVGIVGALTTGEPTPTGECESIVPPIDPTQPPSILPSFSVFGSIEVPNGFSNETEIPIRVWGIPSNSPSISNTCASSDCPNRRFVALQRATGSFTLVRIRYFEGSPVSFSQFLDFPYLITQRFIPKAGSVHIQAMHPDTHLWEDCGTPPPHSKPWLRETASRFNAPMALTPSEVSISSAIPFEPYQERSNLMH